MPRAKHKLTAKQVEHAKPGRHGDGAGLSLLVKPSGTRSWTVRVTVDGKRRDIGIGSWPKVSLSEARQRNAEMQAEARGDGDPTNRRQRVPTFREAAAEVHALNLPRWRNPKTGREWLARLERYAFESLGSRPVHRITRTDVLAVLEPIWTTKHEAASTLRQTISQVFEWAVAHGYVEYNVAEQVRGALPKLPPKRGGHAAVDAADIPAVAAAIDAAGGSDAVRLCLRFLILTAARSGEARGARWSEIDYDAALWTIPAERMKSNREHSVPLSAQAVETLRKAEALDDGSGLVFPSPLRTGEPLSWSPLCKMLKRLGIEATVHGFRSSFRSWALEQPGVSWAAAELSLAHRVGNDVERRYIRTTLLEQRRALMADWADFATGAP